MNTKKCPCCGNELPQEINFCLYCMTKLIKEENYNIYPKQKKQINKKYIGIVILIIIFMILTAPAWIYLVKEFIQGFIEGFNEGLS